MEQQEQTYENPLLDGIHQLFPEILYDTAMFPHNDANSILGWVRYRVMHFYPQTFRRFRQIYQERDQANARNDFEDWNFLQNRLIRQQQPATRLIYRNDFITPPRNSIIPERAIYTPPRNAVRTWEESVNLLNTTLGPSIDSWLATFLESTVTVRPTNAQIEAASEIVQHDTVAEGTMCTICQENVPSPREQPAVWRRLRGCSHIFHKACIDRWFSRNVHCPVCRADIRGQRAPDSDSTPTTAEMPDSPM